MELPASALALPRSEQQIRVSELRLRRETRPRSSHERERRRTNDATKRSHVVCARWGTKHIELLFLSAIRQPALSKLSSWLKPVPAREVDRMRTMQRAANLEQLNSGKFEIIDVCYH